MTQDRKNPSKDKADQDEVQSTPSKADLDARAAREAARDEELDGLLDEIDDVLETNAEEFVKSFIQKGGQ